MLSSQREGPKLSSQKPAPGESTSRKSSRVRELLSLTAAVLVVAVIVGTAFLLFSQRAGNPSSGIANGASIGPIGTPATAHTYVGDLEASLQITSGPYFLSELLAVDVTLTNYGKQSVLLEGTSADINSCDAAISVTTSGGGEPHYNLPASNVSVSCPGPGVTQLDAGRTLVAHGYVPLLKSGQVAVMPGARFPSVKSGHGIKIRTTDNSPLDGRWPVIHIAVATSIPADRTLSLQQHASQVTINAPASIRPHLVYFYSIFCVGESGTNMQWTPLTTLTLQEPGCSGLNKHWFYAVSAPGYAIAEGELSSL